MIDAFVGYGVPRDDAAIMNATHYGIAGYWTRMTVRDELGLNYVFPFEEQRT